jgi:hypothetical protein
MSNLIEDVKKEYLKQLRISKMELGNLDPVTKYTQEGVVNAAKQKLEALKPEVMRLVLNDSTSVFVESGLDLESGIKELTEEHNNIKVLDFQGIEKRILDQISPKDKTKPYYFNAEMVSKINIALFDLRNLLGATFIPPISMSANEYCVLQTQQEALNKLQSLLEKKLGLELKTLYLAKQMNDLIDENLEEYNKMVFFVVNTNKNPYEAARITGQNVVITGKDEVENSASSIQRLVALKLKNNKKKLTQSES